MLPIFTQHRTNNWICHELFFTSSPGRASPGHGAWVANALTPLKLKLLYHLARNAGRLLMHEAILDRVWGIESVYTVDHLKVFISRIRAKLDRAGGPSFIETERRLGYSFVHQPVGVD